MLIYLLNGLMLSRIIYTFEDNRLEFKQLPYVLIIQMLGLAMLKINLAWIILLISSLILNALVIFWERKSKNPRIVRIVSLLTFSIIYSLIISLSGKIHFNPAIISWLRNMMHSSSIGINITQLSRTNTYALGFLFIINEANTIIRQIFDWIKISPQSSENGPAETEPMPPSDKVIEIDAYKSGRVIGILERIFVYFAVMINEYSIIGFIVAAKAFARFKELDKKAFAEYVLIGTLTSILIALMAASFTASLIKADPTCNPFYLRLLSK